MNVSRETFAKLKKYQSLLEVWQQKINLVSPQSLEHAWERHFKDSYQLISYLPPETVTLCDVGSGAGFPGLVLAILRPKNLFVTLVESDFKKCIFLENVSRETMTEVKILNARIESLKNISADVITARALAPLCQLLGYAYPLLKNQGMALFLKGKDAEREIKEAQKKWDFSLEIHPSLTDSKGRILQIKNLSRVNSND